MKGKLAFVLGAAVGYVLGTRAGRERYEQMKRGALQLWNTEPVQRGVGAAQELLDDRLDDLKEFAKRVGIDVVNNIGRQRSGENQTAGSTSARASEPQAQSTAADTGSEAKGSPAATDAEPGTPS